MISKESRPVRVAEKSGYKDLLLGLGLYWKAADVSAAVVFVLSMISLLVCAGFYIREVNVALSSVQDEAHDLNFMDVGRV